ncbi:hypothetical protein NKH10_29005 [Mesorhizobium sp. M1340]
MKTGKAGLALSPRQRAKLDIWTGLTRSATSGRRPFRKVVDIAIMDQSDTKGIPDKAQKDARTDVMFDDSGKRHVAANSVAEQECFAPAHQ